jgi:hypothetical protein
MTLGRPSKFAVLLHSGAGEPHYDLLFESAPDSSLVTFRLAEWPPAKGQLVTKLRDHRRLYLTYEGDIPGGGRGRVDRVADGQLLVAGGPAGWRLRRADGRPFMTITPDELEPAKETWWLAPADDGGTQP